jgi:hypothetical protein
MVTSISGAVRFAFAAALGPPAPPPTTINLLGMRILPKIMAMFFGLYIQLNEKK